MILQAVVDMAKTCTVIKGDPTLGVCLQTVTRMSSQVLSDTMCAAYQQSVFHPSLE